jgi:hypothetical protein
VGPQGPRLREDRGIVQYLWMVMIALLVLLVLLFFVGYIVGILD